MGAPDMTWLRLTPRQTRVLLCAWSYDRIVCSGRNLNTAHRLNRRNLLVFHGPVDGGLKGVFSLSEDAKAYPPTGLKALVVRKHGQIDVSEPTNDH